MQIFIECSQNLRNIFVFKNNYSILDCKKIIFPQVASRHYNIDRSNVSLFCIIISTHTCPYWKFKSFWRISIVFSKVISARRNDSEIGIGQER